MTTDCVLTADLGAGSLRAALVASNRRGVLAQARQALATAAPRPGWMEADPEVWWQALSALAASLLSRLGRRRVRVMGVCLTGMTRSQVFLDQAGRVLRPAILWQDARAAGEDSQSAAEHFAAGDPATAVNAFHPLARLTWLRRVEPAAWDALALVLEPKDYLNWRLTRGVAGADGVTAARLDPLGTAPHPEAPEWLHRALALLRRLPRPMPWEAIGTVCCPDPPWDALRGVPVFAGSQDGWAGAVGAGAVRPGDAYDICGTSEVAGLLTDAPASAPGLVGLPWAPGGTWQLGGPTQAGGAAVAWAHRTFRATGRLPAALERAGRLGTAGTADLLRLPHFVPYLAGERAPVWRSDVRGAFALVAAEHGPDALLWAAMEGVARLVGDIVCAAAAGAPGVAPPRTVLLAGGGARSSAWAQLRADVLGVPVLRPMHLDAGLLGCAAAALTGLGALPRLADAATALNPVRDALHPDPARADAFAARAHRRERLRALALELSADGVPA